MAQEERLIDIREWLCHKIKDEGVGHHIEEKNVYIQSVKTCYDYIMKLRNSQEGYTAARKMIDKYHRMKWHNITTWKDYYKKLIECGEYCKKILTDQGGMIRE